MAGTPQRSELAAQPPSPVPDVYATHAPMHPMGDERVTFRAQATGVKVTLSYERFALAVQRGGTVSQTSTGPAARVRECIGSGPITCTYTMPSAFPAASLVRFDATAESSTGAVGRDSYFFAAGAYPRPDAPIPVRLKTATVNAALDVIFIRTADLPIDELRNSLSQLLDVYHRYEPLRKARGFYNIYYSRHAGGYQQRGDETGVFTDPVNMAVLLAKGDAIVFLHRARLRDSRLDKRMSSEVVDEERSLVHETGHVLFGLQDEYESSSSHVAQECAPNLWANKSACEGAAPSLGYSPDDCWRLVTPRGDFWRLDPEGRGGCILGNAGRARQDSVFRAACDRRLKWRHTKCQAGKCFTNPDCP